MRSPQVKKLNIANYESREFPSRQLREFENLEELHMINYGKNSFDPTQNPLEFDTLSLRHLRTLKSVSFVGIGFNQFPMELSHIPKLETLSIVMAELDSLPADLSAFESLKIVDLSLNHIKQLPVNMVTKNAVDLRVPNNKINGFPDEFFKDTYLNSLDISNREGTLPTLPQNAIDQSSMLVLFRLVYSGKIKTLTVNSLSCSELEKLKELIPEKADQKRVKLIHKPRGCKVQ